MSRSHLLEQTGPAASLRRIRAQVLRYLYLLRSSTPRLVELVYWPLVQMLMWGFLQSHLVESHDLVGRGAGLLMAGFLLWDLLVRSQFGYSISFLEEMWSRNLGHLMMSPLRPGEFVAALVVVSFIRVLIGLVPAILLAWGLFGFNLFSMGLPLAFSWFNLALTSWSLGLVTTGLVLRYGLGVESIAWTAVFVLLPLSCVYYPLSTLPAWLQPVSQLLPPTHVFEAMRALMLDNTVRGDLLLVSLALNVVYLAAAYRTFIWFMRQAQVDGALLQLGE
jgi:ABC-2 type transport system permease protein